MSEGTNSNAVGALVTDTVSHLHQLMRKEVQLARAEVEEKVSKAAVAAILIVVAALAALIGLNVLAGAAAAALVAGGLTPWIAACIVALAFLTAAVVTGLIAKSILSNLTLAPEDTLASLKRDGRILKETMNDH